MHAVEKLKCCCCKTKFFSLMKKSKFFVLAQKEDKSLFFQKNKQKTHTKLSNCFQKVNQKNWLLGGNFCKIWGKCGWSNVFSQNQKPFHLWILQIGKMSFCEIFSKSKKYPEIWIFLSRFQKNLIFPKKI